MRRGNAVQIPEDNMLPTLLTVRMADEACHFLTFVDQADEITTIGVVHSAIQILARIEMLGTRLEPETIGVEPFAAAIAGYHLVLLAVGSAANAVQLACPIAPPRCSRPNHRQ
jgi:hypothetical protein